MIPDPSSGAISTTLHRNPFAILGASITSTRSEINSLAEEKAFTLDEAVVQDAKRILTNPRARLEAEVGWLPGLSDSEIRWVLSSENMEQLHFFGKGQSALTQANILCAGLELQPSGNPPATWSRNDLLSLLKLTEGITNHSVLEMLNGYRSVSGFPQVDAGQMSDALTVHRRYFMELCRRALDKLWMPQRREMLVSFLRNSQPAPDLLHELVDEYALSITPELNVLLEAINTEKVQIARFPKSSEMEVERISKKLEAYGALVHPILLSREARGLDHAATLTLFREIRNVAIDLANDYEQFDPALKITMALQGAVGVVEKLRALLAVDIKTLTRLIETRSGYARHAAVIPTTSTNRRPAPSPNRWPGESTPQSPSASKVQTNSPWSRIPGFIKVIAVLMLIGWGGDALSDSDDDSPPGTTSSRSSTSGSQPVDQCADILAWWDDSDLRWEQMMNLYDPNQDVSLQNRTTMQQLIVEQRRSDPPSAAYAYNNATVTYMQFLLDDANNPTTSPNEWNIEQDRLLREVQIAQQNAADSCDIKLVQAPTSYSSGALIIDTSSFTVRFSEFMSIQSRAKSFAYVI